MAGAILTTTTLPPLPLRRTPLFVLAPAFPLLLTQGLISRRVNPAIGILPLFLSAVFSAYLLSNTGRIGLAGTPVHLVADVVLALALLTCLILDWVMLPMGGGGGGRGMAVLGTYGTLFLMVDLGIHLYFAVLQLRDVVASSGRGGGYNCDECSRCRFGSAAGGRHGTRGEYDALLDGEGEARGSRDEDGDGEMV